MSLLHTSVTFYLLFAIFPGCCCSWLGGVFLYEKQLGSGIIFGLVPCIIISLLLSTVIYLSPKKPDDVHSGFTPIAGAIFMLISALFFILILWLYLQIRVPLGDEVGIADRQIVKLGLSIWTAGYFGGLGMILFAVSTHRRYKLR